MTTLDDLNARLLALKIRLRQFEEASADTRKAAQHANAEHTPDEYLFLAAGLDEDAAGLRAEIAELEAERKRLS